jgi:flagellar biosynthesis protein FlhG
VIRRRDSPERNPTILPEPCTIIPIAGGKGGVGKSLITANLAIALAEMGHSTVVVDLDLGNSNLHSLLGLPNRYPGIGDYLRTGNFAFEELLIVTQTPRLLFLPGDGRMPFMANITHSQKIHLISKIRQIPARYVLLDLGAGCAFNTLDFFGIVNKGIVVSTPEYPSVMSALVFLKNFVIRKIDRALSKNYEIAELLESLYVQPMQEPHMTVSAFQKKLERFYPGAVSQVQEICRSYTPRLVFNVGEHPNELEFLEQVSQTAKEVLSLELEYFGFIFFDPAVRESIKQHTALIPHKRDSQVARDFFHLAERVVDSWNGSIPNSAEHLINYTRQEYEARSRSRTANARRE